MSNIIQVRDPRRQKLKFYSLYVAIPSVPQPYQSAFIVTLTKALFMHSYAVCTLHSRLYNRLSLVDGQQGGCVDSRRCGAVDRFFKKNSYLFTYILPTVAYDPERWQKLYLSQNSIKLSLLYLFTRIDYNIRNVSFNRLYNRLYSPLYTTGYKV